MKTIITIVVFSFISFQTFPKEISEFGGLKDKNINYFTKVLPPSIFTDRIALNKIQTLQYNVTYDYLFPSLARSAFEYALNIWSYLLNSSIRINIHAKWGYFEAGEENVLAKSYPGCFKKINNVDYPVALAEAKTGIELNNESDYDIIIEVNKKFADEDQFYYLTDGDTPSDKSDFVTIMMHEFAHGLGYCSSMKVENGAGSWGTEGIPIIYDLNLVLGNNSSYLYHITNTSQYQNPSSELGVALTSDNIYFDGLKANQMNFNSLPKLYAPDNWEGGSSITHLDETEFPEGNRNSLMTPSLGHAEAIHTPGEIGLAILEDIGWNINRIITYIEPKPEITYQINHSVEIKWIDNFGGFVNVNLYKRNIYGVFIFANTITSMNSYRGSINYVSWTPSTEGIYKIRIIENNQGYGESPAFEVSSIEQIPMPVINPPGGVYGGEQHVNLSSSVSGCNIFYTLNGDEPTTSTFLYNPNNPIIVGATLRLKAKAFKDGFLASPIASEYYVIASSHNITIAQKDISNYSFGTFNYYYNNQWFYNNPSGIPISFPFSEILRLGIKFQDFKDLSIQKWYNSECVSTYWWNNYYYDFSVTQTQATGYYKPSGTAVISMFLEGEAFDNKGSFEFKDPWLVIPNDQRFKIINLGYRNLGMGSTLDFRKRDNNFFTI